MAKDKILAELQKEKEELYEKERKAKENLEQGGLIGNADENIATINAKIKQNKEREELLNIKHKEDLDKHRTENPIGKLNAEYQAKYEAGKADADANFNAESNRGNVYFLIKNAVFKAYREESRAKLEEIVERQNKERENIKQENERLEAQLKSQQIINEFPEKSLKINEQIVNKAKKNLEVANNEKGKVDKKIQEAEAKNNKKIEAQNKERAEQIEGVHNQIIASLTNEIEQKKAALKKAWFFEYKKREGLGRDIQAAETNVAQQNQWFSKFKTQAPPSVETPAREREALVQGCIIPRMLDKIELDDKCNKEELKEELKADISKLKAEDNFSGIKLRDSYEDLEKKNKKAESDLAKAQAELEGIKNKQYPNRQQDAEQLVVDIKNIAKKSPEEKQELMDRINKMPEIVLTTKVGNPPESLLSIASKTPGAGSVGISMLNKCADKKSIVKFSKEDMQAAIKVSHVQKEHQQEKSSQVKNANLSTEETEHNLRDVLHKNASVPVTSVPMSAQKQEEQQKVKAAGAAKA